MTATATPGFALDLVWDEVARRLHAMLAHRGVRREIAEDVVQETAVRIIEREVPFVDADDLFRWTAVVAWRLVIDAARRDGRLCDLPREITSNEDVASEAVGRWWLGAVRRGLQQLSPDERAAILDTGVHADRKTAVRTAVRRHRARARLLTLAESLGVCIALVVRSASLRSRRGAATATLVAATAVSLGPHYPSYPVDEGMPPGTNLRAHVPAAAAVTPDARPAQNAVVDSPAKSVPRPVERGVVAAPRDAKALPSTRVTIDGPTGSGDLGTRPKQDGDALMCVTVTGLERACVSLPVQLTR
ncbi:MAG TPA: sigma-70 family RNA polymerase sigma factor [Acidimicrobiales bacterium]|nr:sigma-70 family RNA polymerase sigma factor [Acidimicrobiales bacterium]